MEDEMGEPCNTHGVEKIVKNFSSRTWMEETNHLGDFGLNGRKMFEWTLSKISWRGLD